MATVRWRKSAEDNHIAWATNIYTTLGHQSTLSYLKDIDDVRKRLELFPSSGSATQSSNVFLRKVASKLGYTIIYEIDDLQNPQNVLIISIGKGT